MVEDTDTPKRKTPRVPVNLPVDLHLPHGTRSYETANISTDGVFIECPEPLALRKVVRFETDLPDHSEPLEMLGLVAHAISPKTAQKHEIEAGMGLRLFSVGRDARQQWLEFVEREYEKREARQKESETANAPKINLHMPSLDKLESFIQRDLDRGTIFVRSANLYSVGTTLICRVLHPNGSDAVEIEANVVDRIESPRKKRGMRLSLTSRDEETKNRLQTLMSIDN